MVEKTLAYLDFTKLVAILRNYSRTPFSESSFDGLRPLAEEAEAEARLDRIAAICDVIRWDGALGLSEVPDVREILRRSTIRGAVLDAKELIQIADFLRACGDVRLFLKKAHAQSPFVEHLLERLQDLPAVQSRIRKTINPEGLLEDTASYELSRIRSELFLYRARIRKHLEGLMDSEDVRPVLQDTYISIRNGRYVIPMKPNFNQAFQGIVHDYSHSLKTSFVEPVAVVELGNTANILDKEEKEEEKKILMELTGFAGRHFAEMNESLQALAEVDFYHAIATFAMEFDCVRPTISVDGELEIRGARNPFIALSKGDAAVPVDLLMDRDRKVMVVSGPNAGGKTAALKTLGLLAAMAVSGLFVPASGVPKVPFYPRFFAIIGDEQDISMDLSSFSAHMRAIKEVFDMASPGDLILIDEIGSSTEPQEASALAMAILDGFVEKDCRVVVTTHLNLLKAYGYTKPYAINVACAFDGSSSKPLYSLIYNTAGYSNAIMVARGLDLPASIIEKSYTYLGDQGIMLNDLVSSLERERARLEEASKAALVLRDALRKKMDFFREKRDEYVRRLEERAARSVARLDEELEETRKELARREKDAINIARGKLDSLRKKYKIASDPLYEEIVPGDYVRVKTLGGVGQVVALDRGRDLYEVLVGNAKTRVPRRYLEKRPFEKTGKAQREIEIHVEPLREREINLTGMRVEDALAEVERHIDRAMVEGLDRVRVRHGIGTGRLMQAVREHLAGDRHVKRLHPDERNPGVTVVELT